MSYEFLHSLAVETKDVFHKVIMEKQISSMSMARASSVR
jgi:hypothetical protein